MAGYGPALEEFSARSALLACAVRRTAFYRQGVRVGGSLAIAALAAAWFAERAFNVELLPF